MTAKRAENNQIRSGTRSPSASSVSSASGGVERHFLPWNEPFLPQVAEYLFKNLAVQGLLPAIDLSNTILVFPGERAALRMAEILVFSAEKQKRGLLPPSIITIGALPELLMPASSDSISASRPAGRCDRRLIWRSVLKQANPELLPQRPTDEADGQWLRLAEMFDKLTETLASEGLDIRQVSTLLSSQQAFDFERWENLSAAYDSYSSVIKAGGLYDRNIARLSALSAGDIGTDRTVVLAGCADLNRVSRNFIDAAATKGRVIALVHAPLSHSSDFDSHGAIVINRWADRAAEISDDSIDAEQSPVDQAKAVSTALAVCGIDSHHRIGASDATVAICDETLLPYVREALAEARLPDYFIGGISADSTPPFGLLASVARVLRSKAFADLAAVARHVDIIPLLTSRHPGSDLPGSIDLLFEKHLPATIDYQLLSHLKREPAGMQPAAAPLLSLLELLAPLEQHGTPAEAGKIIRQFLANVYTSTGLTLDTCERRALPILGRMIAELEMAADQQPIPVHAAIDLLLDLTSAEKFQLAPTADSVLITGWLDLAHDDAPIAVICGFNDSVVPAPLSGDSFLPTSLRTTLGIEDDRRRLARDSYLLESIVNSKKFYRIILGKESHDQSPLSPSRLLLRCRGEKLALRMLSLATHSESKSELDLSATSQSILWRPSKPPPLGGIVKSIRVTGFRTYLSCPYLFYLQHVLGLENHDDYAQELDARQFGTLIHEVLAAFGADSRVRDSNDPKEISDFLQGQAEATFSRDYGLSAHPAVNLQFRHAISRLRAFSIVQAVRRDNGWRIEEVERPFQLSIEPAAQFVANLSAAHQAPVEVRGRIDRIDRHEKTGELAIFDYKTGDSIKLPVSAHRTKNGKWHDLQLPLYRAFADTIYPDTKISDGYICLPADTTKIDFALSAWGEDDLSEGYLKACEIAGMVRAEVFWPPTKQATFGDESDFAKLYGRERFAEISDSETSLTGDESAEESE